MTECLYMDDMVLSEFSTRVASIDGDWVELESTAFYPLSGGVEGDTGTLTRGDEEFDVVAVTKEKGRVMHRLDRPGLAPGDDVTGRVDWERRHLLMRYHTATHVLSGVFSRVYGAKITGNKLTTEKGRMDFSLEEFDREILEEGFKRANEVIGKDLSVATYYKSREEVEQDPELVKLAMGLPPGIKTLRIVDIQGFDAQPDGGCHVSRLSEVGGLVFLKAENKGKSNRRVYFTLEAPGSGMNMEVRAWR